jgi:hypothetical protein
VRELILQQVALQRAETARQLQMAQATQAAAIAQQNANRLTAAYAAAQAQAQAAAVAASGKPGGPPPPPRRSRNEIPVQDAATYAALYSMYSESNPEYAQYKVQWEEQQARFRAERAQQQQQQQEVGGGRSRGHAKSRSIYSPEPSSLHAARSASVSPIPSGVCSPIPGGGLLIAENTALCLLVQTSRPNSVAASPIPGYVLARDRPMSPSLMAGESLLGLAAQSPRLALRPIAQSLASR